MDPELMPLIGLSLIALFIAGLTAAIVRSFNKED